MEVYFLSTTSKNNGVTRCVGVFGDRQGPEEVLANNWGNLNEDGHYEYAVLERSEATGLYPQLEQLSWWEFCGEAGWQRIDRPACFHRVRNFALG